MHVSFRMLDEEMIVVRQILGGDNFSSDTKYWQ